MLGHILRNHNVRNIDQGMYLCGSRLTNQDSMMTVGGDTEDQELSLPSTELEIVLADVKRTVELAEVKRVPRRQRNQEEAGQSSTADASSVRGVPPAQLPFGPVMPLAIAVGMRPTPQGGNNTSAPSARGTSARAGC